MYTDSFQGSLLFSHLERNEIGRRILDRKAQLPKFYRRKIRELGDAGFGHSRSEKKNPKIVYALTSLESIRAWHFRRDTTDASTDRRPDICRKADKAETFM